MCAQHCERVQRARTSSASTRAAANFVRSAPFLTRAVSARSIRFSYGSKLDLGRLRRSAVWKKRTGTCPFSRSGAPLTRAGHHGKPKTRAHTRALRSSGGSSSGGAAGLASAAVGAVAGSSSTAIGTASSTFAGASCGDAADIATVFVHWRSATSLRGCVARKLFARGAAHKGSFLVLCGTA